MNRSNPCRFSTPPKDRRSDAFGAAAAKTLRAASLTGRTAMAVNAAEQGCAVPQVPLSARAEHRRQGFGKKRTPSDATGTPLRRQAAAPARLTGAA
ncbi:hypothetical protein [uncultured Arthrobacter sp.]|uniref:hypothetical protein n=1 Tax=uncultured Arthrobacter sp. TaxID=114050 RepID=UPI0028D33661|nr:hypothetical protein [uncultured Arthrobacter sp.]